MALDKGHMRWRKIRIPLFVGIGLTILAALGVVASFWLRGVAIESDIREAREAAAQDTVEGMRLAVESLSEMSQRHSGRSDVQAAYGYVLALDALRNGPTEAGLEKAQEALGRSDATSGDELYHAGTALVLLGKGQPEEALGTLSGLPDSVSRVEEVRLARLMSQISAGQSLEARVELELMAVRDKPFLPAVTLLGQLRHRLGDLEGARLILQKSLESHPGRLEASVELALVLVDTGTEESLAEAEKVISSIARDLDGAPPLLATRGMYCEGMLLLAREQYARAVVPLCDAASRMEESTLPMARCARAHRLSGDVRGALEVLGQLEFDDSTPTTALLESVEANLALWRPRSAAPALGLLGKRPDIQGSALSLMMARAAEMSGDFDGAAKGYRVAGTSDDLPIRAGLAYIQGGQAKEAKNYLRGIDGGPSAGCAQALRDWSRGKFVAAFKQFGVGEPCDPALRGRLLLLSGRFAEAVESLSNAGDSDPRVTVLLARATFRTSGAEAARAMITPILEMEPESIVLLAEIAYAFMEMGLTDDARGAVADAVERNHGDPDALALQIAVLRLTSDPGSAWEILDGALAANPEHPGLLVQKAHSLLEDKNYSEAVQTAQKAMDSPAWLLEASIVVARALDALNDDSGADSVLRKTAATLYAGHEPTLSALAYAEFIAIRRSRPDKSSLAKAKGMFSTALKKEISSAQLFHEGALVYIADGRRDDGVKWLHEAAAADPAFKPPFQKLAKMGELTEDESAAYIVTHGVAP
jgi:tetratricopeptide (TPR) repeat protein